MREHFTRIMDKLQRTSAANRPEINAARLEVKALAKNFFGQDASCSVRFLVTGGQNLSLPELGSRHSSFARGREIKLSQIDGFQTFPTEPDGAIWLNFAFSKPNGHFLSIRFSDNRSLVEHTVSAGDHGQVLHHANSRSNELARLRAIKELLRIAVQQKMDGVLVPIDPSQKVRKGAETGREEVRRLSEEEEPFTTPPAVVSTGETK